jgi:hypothetical protein
MGIVNQEASDAKRFINETLTPSKQDKFINQVKHCSALSPLKTCLSNRIHYSTRKVSDNNFETPSKTLLNYVNGANSNYKIDNLSPSPSVVS